MVFRRELRVNLLGLVIWTVVLALTLMTLILMYPSFIMRQEEIVQAVNGIPVVGVLLYNIDAFSESIAGYYANFVGGLQLFLGAIFSLLLGASLLCKEEEDGTAEFILSGPIKRGTVVLQKLCALWLLILMLDVALVALCGLVLASMHEPVSITRLVSFGGGLALPHIQLGTMAFAISAMCRRRRTARAISIIVSLALLLLGIFARTDATYSFLAVASPFARAAVSAVQSGVEHMQVVVAAGVTIICILWSMAYYHRKNLTI